MEEEDEERKARKTGRRKGGKGREKGDEKKKEKGTEKCERRKHRSDDRQQGRSPRRMPSHDLGASGDAERSCLLSSSARYRLLGYMRACCIINTRGNATCGAGGRGFR